MSSENTPKFVGSEYGKSDPVDFYSSQTESNTEQDVDVNRDIEYDYDAHDNDNVNEIIDNNMNNTDRTRDIDEEDDDDDDDDDDANTETVFNIDENGDHVHGDYNENNETVFNIDENGDDVDDNNSKNNNSDNNDHYVDDDDNEDEYDLDFTEYSEPTNGDDITGHNNFLEENENNKQISDIDHNENDKQNIEHLTTDESIEREEGGDTEIDTEDADDYDDYDDAEELVVPDIGITRESSITSRITNESDIFSNPRKPSVAFPHPTLQTLSEEMKQFSNESDSNFISMVNTKNTNSKSPTPVRSTTLTSTRLSKIPDNSMQFISNARYSQSIISYDNGEEDEDNDDAFSFQIDDDKEYEMGYVPKKINENNSNQNESDETDTNLTDTESINNEEVITPTGENSVIAASDAATPPVPFAPKVIQNDNKTDNRDSIVNANELRDEVGAMRNQFVRSDMHPSVMSKMTNVVGFNNDDIPELPKGLAISSVRADNEIANEYHGNNRIEDIDNNEIGDDNNNDTLSEELELNKTKSSSSIGYNKSNRSTSTVGGKSLEVSSSLSGSNKSFTPQPQINNKNLKSDEIFNKIPDVDLYQMFLNNSKIGDNISKLKDIRIELNDLNTGLTEWISYNMGDSMKINMEDDKLGPHVKEAIKFSEENNTNNNRNTFTGISNFSDTMENMAHEFGDFGGRNVSKFREVVKEVKVKKIGQRGRTLLRKLKKVPEFTNNT